MGVPNAVGGGSVGLWNAGLAICLGSGSHLAGTDHYQYVYVLRCGNCSQEYEQTAPTFFSTSAPTARTALRGSRYSSL